MHRIAAIPMTALASLALGALAACAGAPRIEATATSDCPKLDAEIAQVTDMQRAAAQKQQDAWKTILPIAAAARFGQGMVEASQSEKRLADLQDRATRQGCRRT